METIPLISTRWTFEEVCQVMEISCRTRPVTALVDPYCGRVVFMLSQDTGFSAAWGAAARVAVRLLVGRRPMHAAGRAG